jgi:hypothetical protein
MSYVAEKYPERYKDILQGLHELGEEVAQYYGGRSSLTAEAFRTPREVVALRNKLKDMIATVRANKTLSPGQKREAVGSALKEYEPQITKALMTNMRGTSFPLQITSGSRGSENALLSMLAGSLTSADSAGEDVDTPILHGFAEGLTPAEYFTSGYAARLGYYGTKFATPVAGDIANQLALAAQRLRVTERDCRTENGILVDTGDTDYEGAVLARDYGTAGSRNQAIDPQMLRKLGTRYDKVLVRSPITCQAEEGICQRCAGRMPEYPEIGDFTGITATQALTEVLSQANIGSKHRGQRATSGLDLIQSLISVPTTFAGAAAIAEESGMVRDVEDTEVGGKKIVVGEREYFLEPGVEPLVDPGQRVEIGEVISQGIPNPKQLAALRGIGAARKAFVDIFSTALKDSGIEHNKRNVGFVARSIINHARMTEPYGEYLPGDVVEYGYLERHWKPRPDSRKVHPRLATGLYLEKPVGHYSIGTRLTKKMVDDLKKGGYKEVTVHGKPPPFQPEMRRAMESMSHAGDWMDRMSGYYTKGSLMDALYSGTTATDPSRKTAVIPQIVLRGNISQIGE